MILEGRLCGSRVKTFFRAVGERLKSTLFIGFRLYSGGVGVGVQEIDCNH